ncbi:MAG: hypothetical protein IAI50_01870, partial [Candidatus Eremiobacteraeota bacterium]|nr:hypothetical protein [Candidatus Eremiobacteraeota bacterium]
KTMLQEWTQRRFGSVPVYVDLAEGPDHERVFRAQLSVADVHAEGVGPSKKAAQRAAATDVLAQLASRYDDVAPRALSQAVTSPVRVKKISQPKARLKKSPAGASKRPHT